MSRMFPEQVWDTLTKTQQAALGKLFNGRQPRPIPNVLKIMNLGLAGIINDEGNSITTKGLNVQIMGIGGDKLFLTSLGERLVYEAVFSHRLPLPLTSFALTTPQILARTKRVTRRSGKREYVAGQHFWAVDKIMGFKKGEHPNRLALLRVVSSRWEPLEAITYEECILEGFPDYGPMGFMAMYCLANKVNPDSLVQRIEFEYVDSFT